MDSEKRMVKLSAQPDDLEVDVKRAAVVVVDMQNAFLKKGGLLDLAGLDIALAPRVISAGQKVLSAARANGMQIIYLQMGYPNDLSTAGGHQSPNPHKELALCLMRDRPELKGNLLIWGTWDAEIADEFAPEPGDLVVRKSRYCGFTNTNLDEVLRTRNLKTLFFIGVATNICVESTVRDAFFHEYWPIVIEDATMQAGPIENQTASLFNIKNFFGWVTSSEKFQNALNLK
jgi:ureidoacrylate peracid hydrolase